MPFTVVTSDYTSPIFQFYEEELAAVDAKLVPAQCRTEDELIAFALGNALGVDVSTPDGGKLTIQSILWEFLQLRRNHNGRNLYHHHDR